MMRKLILVAILTATIDPVIAQVACPNPVPENPTREQIVACLRDIQKLKDRPHQLEIIAGTANEKGEIEQRVIGATAHRVISQPTNGGLYTFKIEPPFKNRPVIIVLPNAGGLNAVVELTMQGGLFNGFKFVNRPLTPQDESRIYTSYKPITFVIVADEDSR
jgi:hypothetical protein